MHKTEQPEDTAHVGKPSDFQLHCKAVTAMRASATTLSLSSLPGAPDPLMAQEPLPTPCAAPPPRPS